MPIGEHLEEARWRVAWAAGLLGVATIGLFTVSHGLVDWLVSPLSRELDEATRRRFQIITVSPTESLAVHLEVSFIAAIFVTAPLTFPILWGFVAAGLYPREKRWVHVMAPTMLVSFLAGVSFLYFGVLPWLCKFLLEWWSNPFLVQTTSLAAYLTFFLWLALLMGAIFETPLVMILLTLTGVVGSAGYSRYRRHAILAATVVAAILTPPDVLSLLLVGGPFVVLYEVGVVAARLLERRRAGTVAAEPVPAPPAPVVDLPPEPR